jgi:predicted ATPase
MFLKKVHVKNFRGLQDVVLEFNQSLSPSVFPVGSLNGGGKSTLLQLIFILLRCSADPQKHHYIRNILQLDLGDEEYELIRFVINHQNEDIDLRFIVASHQLSDQSLDVFYELTEIEKTLKRDFGSDISPNIINGYILELRQIIQRLKESKNLLTIDQWRRIKNFAENLQNFLDQHNWSDRLSLARRLTNKLDQFNVSAPKNGTMISQLLNELLNELEDVNFDLNGLIGQLISYNKSVQHILAQLGQVGYKHITQLSEKNLLFCETSSSQSFLSLISEHIYLAFPLTQFALFLDRNFLKEVLSIEGDLNYMKSLKSVKEDLGSLYTYEFFPVQMLIDIFQRCIKEDTKIGLNSDAYGTSLMKLKKEINEFFTDKTVSIENDFTTILLKKRDSDQALLPEDLSHGELKKFGIYLWLKYMEIKDAIVLMDEVEIGFHPDWQYEIIHELLEWSNNNQFILATHSYDLCSAVTPAHVNEIEPRLNSKRQDSQDNQ